MSVLRLNNRRRLRYYERIYLSFVPTNAGYCWRMIFFSRTMSNTMGFREGSISAEFSTRYFCSNPISKIIRVRYIF